MIALSYVPRNGQFQCKLQFILNHSTVNKGISSLETWNIAEFFLALNFALHAFHTNHETWLRVSSADIY